MDELYSPFFDINPIFSGNSLFILKIFINFEPLLVEEHDYTLFLQNDGTNVRPSEIRVIGKIFKSKQRSEKTNWMFLI